MCLKCEVRPLPRQRSFLWLQLNTADCRFLHIYVENFSSECVLEEELVRHHSQRFRTSEVVTSQKSCWNEGVLHSKKCFSPTDLFVLSFFPQTHTHTFPHQRKRLRCIAYLIISCISTSPQVHVGMCAVTLPVDQYVCRHASVVAPTETICPQQQQQKTGAG